MRTTLGGMQTRRPQQLQVEQLLAIHDRLAWISHSPLEAVRVVVQGPCKGAHMAI